MKTRFHVSILLGWRTSTADLAPFAAHVPPDLGRFEITLDPADRYAFKTPSLRDAGHTAPYMHDGSLATLEEVVDFYDRGGGDAPDNSQVLSAPHLGSDEERALVAFLRSLTGASPATPASNKRPLGLP